MVALILGLGLFAQDAARERALAAELDAHLRAVSRGDPSFRPPLVADGIFLRRVMLDLVGFPPNAYEIGRFSADPDPDKRAKRVAWLLSTERFADYWARKFAAFLLGDTGEVRTSLSPLSPEERKALAASFIDWLKTLIRRDRPYDRIAAEIVGATGAASERPAVAYRLSFYRERYPLLKTTDGISRHFLGIQIGCAGCHDHPFDRWTHDDYYGLAAFAMHQEARILPGPDGRRIEVREGPALMEDPALDAWIRRRGKLVPRFPFAQVEDPVAKTLAEGLASRIVDPRNKQFSVAAVNRVWSWLFARGIVEPVEDFQIVSQKHAVSLKALDLLAAGFRENGHSLHWLVRVIARTDAYQQAGIDLPGLAAPRPLSTEQFLNAFRVATLGVPAGDAAETRAAAAAFFPPGAEPTEVTPLPLTFREALYARNNAGLWDAIRAGDVLSEIRSRTKDIEKRVEAIFVAALSRPPRVAERERYAKFLEGRGDEGLADAYWTLLNTPEFLTRN